MFRPTATLLRRGRFKVFATAGLILLTAASTPVWAKHSDLKLPAYDKLTSGAGPETNDVSAGGRKIATAPRLTPVTLGEDNTDSSSDTSGGDAKAGYLKSTVSMTGFAPKGPIDPSSTSLFAPKDNLSDKVGTGSVLKQARSVNAMPLPLMESEGESQKKLETMLDAEKEQLADLWEAALTRSPDIQFVVQKLMPTSNPGHASTVMMRLLGNAIFGAMGAVSMMSPSPLMYGGTNMGAGMIMNVLQMQENKQAQKAHISQTEAIMLYNMVRGTADKLVDQYRNYKKSVTTLTKSLTDLQDLQEMVREARQGQDSAKQVEMDYTIKKAQRDVDSVSEDVKRYRQGLVDLAGVESVAKLDKQLDNEQSRIEQASPGSTPGDSKTAERPGGASS